MDLIYVQVPSRILGLEKKAAMYDAMYRDADT